MLIQCRYKYVICSKHNNGIMWEPGPNRAMSPVLTIGNSVVLTIDDQFRVHMPVLIVVVSGDTYSLNRSLSN